MGRSGPIPQRHPWTRRPAGAGWICAVLALVLAVPLLVDPAHAEDAVLGEASGLPATARVSPDTVAPGEEGVLEVTLSIPFGTHVYAEDGDDIVGVKVEGVPQDGIEWLPDRATRSKAKDWKDPLFGDVIAVHDGALVLRMPFRRAKEARGELSVALRLGYSACDDELCHPRVDGHEVGATLAAVPETPAGVTSPEPSEEPAGTAQDPLLGPASSDVPAPLPLPAPLPVPQQGASTSGPEASGEKDAAPPQDGPHHPGPSDAARLPLPLPLGDDVGDSRVAGTDAPPPTASEPSTSGARGPPDRQGTSAPGGLPWIGIVWALLAAGLLLGLAPALAPRAAGRLRVLAGGIGFGVLLFGAARATGLTPVPLFVLGYGAALVAWWAVARALTAAPGASSTGARQRGAQVAVALVLATGVVAWMHRSMSLQEVSADRTGPRAALTTHEDASAEPAPVASARRP